MKTDDLGDRMKDYERVETARKFDVTLPIYARIDGRGFSKFTKGMGRPFDPQMTAAMIETTRHLVEVTHAVIGYVQSDEISLVWQAPSAESSVFFDGKTQKMTSVLAGIATAAFTKAIRGWAPYEDRMPHFDARVCQLPSQTEAANMFYWRCIDARKNAVSMAARAHYSAKDMHGKDQTAMLKMLLDTGIIFDEYPAAFRRGTFLRRVTRERPVDASELAHLKAKGIVIPDTVIRSVVEEYTVPFLDVVNRTEIIFENQRPVYKREAA